MFSDFYSLQDHVSGMSQNKFGYHLPQKFFLEADRVVFGFESFSTMTTFQSTIAGFPKLIFQTTRTFFLSLLQARILAFAGSLFRLYPMLEDGIFKAAQGITSLEEVLRVVSE